MQKSEMTSYLNNGYDVMNYFAKFEKFLPHSIIIPSFTTVGSQMPKAYWEGSFAPPPPYKIGSQNTPYKLGLKMHTKLELSIFVEDLCPQKHFFYHKLLSWKILILTLKGLRKVLEKWIWKSVVILLLNIFHPKPLSHSLFIQC